MKAFFGNGNKLLKLTMSRPYLPKQLCKTGNLRLHKIKKDEHSNYRQSKIIY